jgi:hypothetical protein
MKTQWRRAAAGLFLFGVSFGYVEAAVVVYLRAVYDPIRRQIHPERPSSELFPLITSEQIHRAAPAESRLIGVEVAREAATMVMLAAIALAATGARQPWLPCFAIAFGTWDFFYYVFLRLLDGWPASLLTWDILFLIPLPWVAPVLAPGIVSVTIFGCGLAALWRPVHMNPIHWIAMTLGGLLIVLSFVWDFQNTMAGGLPHPFAWRLFTAGELLGVSAFLHAAGTGWKKTMPGCNT